MKLRTSSAACTTLLCVTLLGLASPATADQLVALTLTGITYADGGTATGSITLDYPTSGAATVACFDITLTDTQLTQAPPIGYGSSTVTMSSSAPSNWWSFLVGPSGPNNTYQLGVYGAPPTGGDQAMEFIFDVPNSLIMGPPPVAPVPFDPTAQGYDGGWFLVEGGIAPGSLVTGGTLDPSVVVPPFQQWQTNYFGCVSCPQSGPNADPLGKGISNTNQFLVGLNPTNPASVFRIIALSQVGGTNTVTWKTSGGDLNAASFNGPTVITNIVQGSVGAADGSYSNNFSDISGPLIIVPVGDTVTNYLDASGTNRFYRIRLGP